MKKFIKILGITIISIFAILYIAFLFVLPNVIDLEKYKPEIQKIVSEQTNLNLDFKNPKISVTPLLEAGIKAEDITIKLPDNSDLLSSDDMKIRISLPSLLLLTVKVSTAEFTNPSLNIDIVEGKAFKAVQAFEEILNKKEESIEETIQTAQKPIINPEDIKIVVPGIKLYNYSAVINDLKSNNFLKLRGDELKFGYNNGKSISLKTAAELFVNETKNVTANIDIDTIIPQQSKLDNEDDKVQRVEIPFVNPVAMYMAYDLKTDINSKIKIREKNNQLVSYGFFDIDNFTLNLDGMKLPESKLHLKTKRTKINLDSDLFITSDEKISLFGMLKYGQNPEMDLKINTNQIHTDNIINLIKATLNSLHIKNELSNIRGEGYFTADTYIKTDFKKLKSNGNITIKDCVIKNIKTKLRIAKVNSIISLDNSILKFIDTTLEAADTLFKIDGTIDEKSYADISVLMEQMPLSKIFSMFLPSEINNAYNVNSGTINLSAKLNGELKKVQGNVKLTVNNLGLTDKINKISYINNLLVADFTSNFKSFNGNINNNNFKLTMNGASVSCDKFNMNIGDKDITINPAVLRINNATDINISGLIKDYIKNPIFNFDANGKVRTKDLKQFLGKDFEIFIKESGAIPVNMNFNGDSKKQTLTASIEADKDNYITPIDLNNVLNRDTIIQTVIDFKGDRLKIKDTGFFIKTITQDPENPEKTITKLEEIVGIDGTITKLNTSTPNINLIKVKIPNDLSGKICAFPKSSLIAKGHMYIFGNLNAPRIRGEFNILNMSIPELYLSMEKALSKFEGKDLDIDIKNLIANGSDYNVLINADLNPSKYFTIKNLNLTSSLTDADKLMKVSDTAMKYMPPAQPTNNSGSSQAADIPVIIKDGNININKIKTGDIILNQTTGKIALSNNIFYLNNLITSAFKGKIKGDVSMNLISGEIKTDLKGNNLDVEQTLLEAAAMKDTLTGTMDFDANISLKGSTYEEQMKTLRGNVNFSMKNGQLGPFGRLENLIMAENIRESAFFQSTIGQILNSLLSFDTTHYNTLTGHLSFDNGIAQINPIQSSGDIMATYIFGDYDLLKNKIDIRLRGRLGSQVSESMGPLSMLNPINLVKATPGMSMLLGKIFFLFCEEVTGNEISLIPDLGKDISDNNATKFQVVIRGDVAKPLTLVKSFKWLALAAELQSAESHVNSLPKNTVPADISTLNSLDKEEIKTQVKEKTKKKLEDTANQKLTEEQKQTIDNTIQTIETNKENINKLKSLFKNKEEAKNTLKEQAQKATEETVNKINENTKQQIQTTEENTTNNESEKIKSESAETKSESTQKDNAENNTKAETTEIEDKN